MCVLCMCTYTRWGIWKGRLSSSRWNIDNHLAPCVSDCISWKLPAFDLQFSLISPSLLWEIPLSLINHQLTWYNDTMLQRYTSSPTLSENIYILHTFYKNQVYKIKDRGSNFQNLKIFKKSCCSAFFHHSKNKPHKDAQNVHSCTEFFLPTTLFRWWIMFPLFKFQKNPFPHYSKS